VGLWWETLARCPRPTEKAQVTEELDITRTNLEAAEAERDEVRVHKAHNAANY
jgi:hypothetical protein